MQASATLKSRPYNSEEESELYEVGVYHAEQLDFVSEQPASL